MKYLQYLTIFLISGIFLSYIIYKLKDRYIRSSSEKKYLLFDPLQPSATPSQSPRPSATPSKILTVPGAPLGLEAIGGIREISLKWSEPNNGGSVITNYYIFLEGEYLDSTTSTNYTIKDIGDGETYQFKVYAVNALGTSPSSESKSVTTLNVPGAPLGLTATGGIREISLKWSEPNNGGSVITNYYVFLEGEYLESTTSTTYTITEIGDGETYKFQVYAVNVVGKSPSSDSKSATTFNVPDAPLNLTATGGIREISLKWSEPNNGGSVIINYYVFLDGEYLDSITSTSYTIKDIGNGETYQFQVYAVNAVGTSTSSESKSATTLNVPVAPLNIDSTSGIKKINLSWTVPKNGGSLITGYYVFLDGEYLGLTTTTSCEISQLSDGKTYNFNIYAVNAVGTSLPGSKTARTLNVPGFPTNLKAEGGVRKVNLTWNAPDNGGSTITDYYVYRGDQYIGSSKTTSYTSIGLSVNTSYTFKICAKNAVGIGSFSESILATTLDVMSPNAPTRIMSLSELSSSERISILANGIGYRNVNITWVVPQEDGGSAITGYRIYRNGSEIGTSTTTSYNDKSYGVTNTTIDKYQISAVNGVGEGSKSTESIINYSWIFSR